VELVISRTFAPHLNLLRSPREMAVGWATEERLAMLTNDTEASHGNV
jgi:hypothetical protein